MIFTKKIVSCTKTFHMCEQFDATTQWDPSTNAAQFSYRRAQNLKF